MVILRLPEKLARLGFSETPPTLTPTTETHSEDWKRECLAWSMVKTMSREGIQQWVRKHKNARPEYTKSILDKINHHMRLIREKEKKHDH